MLDALSAGFPDLLVFTKTHDVLGPYAIMALAIDPSEAKRQCIALETMHPSSRLIDLDVYDANGNQVDRKSQGLPARSCLVCGLPAVECIRFKRHAYDEVIGKVHELLAHFRT